MDHGQKFEYYSCFCFKFPLDALMRRWVHIAGHCLEASAWGFCLGFTFCDLVGSVARVDGVSMQPTLNPASERPRDWIFVNTWNSRFYEYLKLRLKKSISFLS